jgi:hypothetical protein
LEKDDAISKGGVRAELPPSSPFPSYGESIYTQKKRQYFSTLEEGIPEWRVAWFLSLENTSVGGTCMEWILHHKGTIQGC